MNRVCLPAVPAHVVPEPALGPCVRVVIVEVQILVITSASCNQIDKLTIVVSAFYNCIKELAHTATIGGVKLGDLFI
jgi:hypothetical protein